MSAVFAWLAAVLHGNGCFPRTHGAACFCPLQITEVRATLRLLLKFAGPHSALHPLLVRHCEGIGRMYVIVFRCVVWFHVRKK